MLQNIDTFPLFYLRLVCMCKRPSGHSHLPMLNLWRNVVLMTFRTLYLVRLQNGKVRRLSLNNFTDLDPRPCIYWLKACCLLNRSMLMTWHHRWNCLKNVAGTIKILSNDQNIKLGCLFMLVTATRTTHERVPWSRSYQNISLIEINALHCA